MGLNSKDSVIEFKEEAAAGYKDSPGICIVIWKLFIKFYDRVQIF